MSALSPYSAQHGNVNGNSTVGGLVGRNDDTITDSYSTGAASGSANVVGGLVGENDGSITNSYSTGSVTGISAEGSYFGGLVGYNVGSITNSYSTGVVTDLAMLVVWWDIDASGTVTASYWDTITSGQSTSAGGTGLTTDDMMTHSSFTGWDIAYSGGSSAVWRIYDGNTYPLLRSFLTPLTVTADNVSQTYNGLAWSGPLSNVSYSVTGADTSGHLLGITTPYGNSKNVGIYAPAMWSDQQGYDISYVNGTLTINPEAITVTAQTNTKTYDGFATAAAIPLITSGSLQGTDTANFSEMYNNKNAGTGKTLTAGGTVTDGNSGNNYITPSSPSPPASINAGAITVTAASRTPRPTTARPPAAMPTITAAPWRGATRRPSRESLQQQERGHGQDPDASGHGDRRQQRQQLHGDLRHQRHGRHHGGGVHGHGRRRTPRPTTARPPRRRCRTITSGTLARGDTATFSESLRQQERRHGQDPDAGGTVNDGNSGNNYTYTFVTNTTGVDQRRAITVTAQTNTKTYDGTTTAAAIPHITSGSLPGATRRPSARHMTTRTSARARP